MRAQKVKQLLESGVSTKLLSTLSDKQINSLYKRMVSEVTMVSKDDSETIKKMQDAKQPYEVYEDDQLDQDIQNADYGDTDQDEKQQGPANYGNNPANDKKMDDNDVDGMGMMEGKKKSKEQNPWAICTAQLGKEFGTKKRHLWSAKEKNKYERCVKDVKKSLKEGKNPVSLFLENEIMKIVEKNIPPRITKGDLVKYLSESGPAVAPSKPKTSPTTKPGKPATRPQKPGHPLKNPNPGEKPAPKAKKIEPEQAKDEVINAIMKILKNG